MGNKHRISRGSHVSKIHEYTKRRDKMSAEAKALKPLINTDKKIKKRYKYLRKHCDHLNAKLSVSRRAIKRLDAVKDYLSLVDKVFIDLTGHKMLNSNMSKGDRKIYAGMFCKFTLQNRVSGYHVRLYVGAKGLWTVSRNRLKIGKLISKNDTWRTQWNLLRAEIYLRGLNKQ